MSASSDFDYVIVGGALANGSAKGGNQAGDGGDVGDPFEMLLVVLRNW